MKYICIYFALDGKEVLAVELRHRVFVATKVLNVQGLNSIRKTVRADLETLKSIVNAAIDGWNLVEIDKMTFESVTFASKKRCDC